MRTRRIGVALAVAAVVAIGLAACADDAPEAPSAPASPGADTATTPTNDTVATETVVLEEGLEHDICGIGLTTNALPRTATSGADDVVAAITAGPVNQVGGVPSGTLATDTLPDNSALAPADADITLMDVAIHVISVEFSSSGLVDALTVEVTC